MVVGSDITQKGGNTMRKIETTEQAWDTLLDYTTATPEALELLTNINGYNMDTMLDALYVLTGYRGFDQLLKED